MNGLDVSDSRNSSDKAIAQGRLMLGGLVFVLSQALPFAVPWILGSGLSAETRTVLSGLLIFGLPEVGTIAAVAIMGKQGYEWLKSQFFLMFNKIRPQAKVNEARYKRGLIMFVSILLLAFIEPYVSPLVPVLAEHRREYMAVLDVLFVLSLFVLGGNFWEKLRSLFIYS